MKKITYLILLTVTATLLSCNQKKGADEGKVVYDTIPVTNITIAPEYYFSGDFTYMADAAVLKETVTGQNLPIAMAEVYPEAEKQYMELGLSGKPVYVELRGYLQPKGADEEGLSQQLVITQVVKMDPAMKSALELVTGKYKAGDKILSINADHTYKLVSGNEKDMQGKWFLIAENMLVLNSDNGHELMDVNWENHQLSTRDNNPAIFSLIP